MIRALAEPVALRECRVTARLLAVERRDRGVGALLVLLAGAAAAADRADDATAADERRAARRGQRLAFEDHRDRLPERRALGGHFSELGGRALERGGRDRLGLRRLEIGRAHV